MSFQIAPGSWPAPPPARLLMAILKPLEADVPGLSVRNKIEELVAPPVILARVVPGAFTNENVHGDSDKGGSATTLSRVFDEIWVSGPAGRDRYRVAQVGVRDDQIREVGRPQLADIARSAGAPATGDAPYTVLYAPTREGFFAEWEYSSILTQGDGILRALLAAPGVRVLFKPHPGTGTDDPAFGREVARLAAERDLAGSLAMRANDGLHRGAFAGSVAAKQADDFAGPHLEIDVEQNLHRPVMRDDIGQREKRRVGHAASRTRRRGLPR